MISNITICNTRLYKDDLEFIIKGIVYQPRHSRRGGLALQIDPLSDDRIDEIREDIRLFSDLNLNAIFVYYINPHASHDECMALLADSGIYVLVNLSDRLHAINRLSPQESLTDDLLTHFHTVIDYMAQYSNTLGVVAANSVINSRGTASLICPVIRDVIIDLKKHMRIRHEQKDQRVLPVCVCDPFCAATADCLKYYTTSDPIDNALETPQDTMIDFYCINCYAPYPVREENTHSSVRTPRSGFDGWNDVLTHFKAASPKIPLLVSEYGSNVGRPNDRAFHETMLLYSLPFAEIFSGGFAYEFFESPNRFGLVVPVRDEDEQEGGGTVYRLQKLADYDHIKMRLAQV